MKWNNNDTKYIIKRLVIYFLIAFAMFIIGTWKASALTLKNYSFSNSSSIVSTTANQQNTLNIPDATLGNGWLYFQFYSVPYCSGNNCKPVLQVKEIRIAGSGTAHLCKLGNQLSYTDATNSVIGYNVECPVDNVVTDLYITWQGVVGNDNYAVGLTSSYGQWYDSNISVSTGGVTSAEFTAFQNQLGQSLAYIVNTLNNSVNSNSAKSAVEALQQQQAQEAQQAHQDAQEIKNTITNDNITSSDADDFKNNEAFTDSTGLESVINLPLNMVNSLSNQCLPIQIHIPYLETDATIPCMSTIYRSKFNNLYTLVKLVVNGFLVYRILLKVYELVHEAKQPDEDKLEVIEL